MKYILVLLLSSQVFAMTLTDWAKLSTDEKMEYLDIHNPTVELKNEQIDSQKYFPGLPDTGIYLDATDDYYSLIGDIQRTLQVYKNEEGKILGARVIYSQQGCSQMNDNGEFMESWEHYESESEAKAANCIDNDVSWTGWSYRDFNGSEFSHSDYMEWSGH